MHSTTETTSANAPATEASTEYASEPISTLHKALDGKPDDWQSDQPVKPLRFTFSGRGRDYLSLWLINWIFTIATLGIYSAWAKVRRLQYVHQNTQLAGYAFGFHGEAQKILIGRIIGIGLIMLSNSMNWISTELTGTFTLCLILMFPWLYRSSIRFYTRNTSYRNIRFKFTGTSKRIYGIYVTNILLLLFTLGFAFPYTVYRLRRYRVNNSNWGHNSFNFSSSTGAFFRIYILSFITTILILAGVGIAVFFSATSAIEKIAEGINNENENIYFIFVGLYALFIYAVYMVAHLLTQDMIYKESWNHINIGPTRFSCDLSIPRLYLIRIGCFLASIATLGIFIPFAHMIITKHRIESISVIPSHDFDVMQAILDEDTTRSAEVADMFDIDIGW
ncbi:YjgN family protein [Hydromonas duriensis]|uniref:Uncharacterized membrane protein YjgN (DUF898 family) n=1 Tax=Hydromonas duriensis TaxID=1527608 RepID=A0A4R6Y8W6_9BURK|nr:YjgN family protein [Hydromonas duriensis]TDR31841.1 uncharacterized membrane protein YjgN (DUF898 family) [Hydromonas duriensis]